jgi:hypothetical protein
MQRRARALVDRRWVTLLWRMARRPAGHGGQRQAAAASTVRTDRGRGRPAGLGRRAGVYKAGRVA